MSSPSSTEPRGGPPEPVRLAILGSTGSIGRQTLDVVEATGEFRVVALAARASASELLKQASRHRPAAVAIADEAARRVVRDGLPGGVALDEGDDAMVSLATRPDVDLVVVGTDGIVSLRPVLSALEAGKVVATANKETLVAGGHLVMGAAERQAARARATGGHGGLTRALDWLRPIDSEHSAIWQCLAGEDLAQVARLILTASGGPFLDLPAAEFGSITPERALRHPTWNMGAKVTVDSATLANKGLEVIEAHWLYDSRYEVIDVVIHPQSIVHSAVQFVDGSIKAQMGTPDMRLPIQYAMTYPRRRPSPAAAPDLVAAARLDFRAPDLGRFPALAIAREAGRLGPRATAALIAADDVAVARFLAGDLDFPGIPRLLEAAVTRFGTPAGDAPDVDELLALDAEVRAATAAMPVSGAAS